MKRIKSWLDHLSAKAILHRLDKRRKIKELDNKKLYSLLCPENQRVQDISSLDPLEIQKVVESGINEQILLLVNELHKLLESKADVVPFTEQTVAIPDDIIFPDQLTNPNSNKVDDSPQKFIPKLSLQEVSALFQSRFGYSLHVARSSISHEEAGNGLWLRGETRPGSVVAFFPGVTYAPIHYKEMLGYPKIDDDNAYLITRYDGLIIDSKPWGHGLHEEEFEGKIQTFSEVYQLEGRHPLAFGHFSNHPGLGMRPNVLLAPFDFKTTTITRPYIPNVKCIGECAVLKQTEIVNGLVLVSSRVIKDEEVFVNYRLNPNMIRPKWYHPVDEKEDLMRWS